MERKQSDKPLLHLRTQQDQPYGSVRKCCERCGLAMFATLYQCEVTEESEYTKEIADQNGLIRCVDSRPDADIGGE